VHGGGLFGEDFEHEYDNLGVALLNNGMNISRKGAKTQRKIHKIILQLCNGLGLLFA
jgi:hypothetical protein